MFIFSHIPTKKALDELGLVSSFDTSVFKTGELEVSPSVNDIKRFQFQYNPDAVEYSTSVDYAHKNAPGARFPKRHYVGGSLVNIPIEIILSDDVDGPPEPFGDLAAALNWFFLLTMPTDQTNQPPDVKYSYGPFSIVGRVTSWRVVPIKSYSDLEPRFARLSLSFDGEPDKDGRVFSI